MKDSRPKGWLSTPSLGKTSQKPQDKLYQSLKTFASARYPRRLSNFTPSIS
jgi:hypothetical protein